MFKRIPLACALLASASMAQFTVEATTAQVAVDTTTATATTSTTTASTSTVDTFADTSVDASTATTTTENETTESVAIVRNATIEKLFNMMDMDVDGEMDEHALAEDIERVFTGMLPKRN